MAGHFGDPNYRSKKTICDEVVSWLSEEVHRREAIGLGMTSLLQALYPSISAVGPP
jgi:hypothetical protein